MNSQDSAAASSSIQHAADMARHAALNAAAQYERPSVLFRPTLSKDGNMWSALLGDNLHVGLAGFGETPDAAMAAFDKAWFERA